MLGRNNNKDSSVEITKSMINDIRNALQVNYSAELIKAMQNSSAINNLEQIIRTKPEFKKFPCYKNPEIAKSIIQEVADIGVIDRLIQKNPNITDISFNGRFLTIETNDNKYTYGLKKGEQKIDEDYIQNLVNRFALREGSKGKNFSSGNPIFNGFNNNIRVSATHSSLSPVGTTMSLRISKPELALNEKNFHNFAPDFIYENILVKAVKAHANIIISGETGTGKTELQKLLIGSIPFEDKIIMIEDVAEMHLTDLYPDKDIFSWITTSGETQEASKKGISISLHVKNALRNNPKWLIISETRGAEAYEMFQAVLSGHNLITTLHAISNDAVPRRFVGMSSLGFDVDEKLLEEDFLRYMHLGVHIKKKIINGHVLRYLDELAEFVPRSDESPDGVHVLYKANVTKKGIRRYKTYEPTAKFAELIFDETDEKLYYPIVSEEDQLQLGHKR